MNVTTISITRETALQKLASYRSLNARQKALEDQRLEQLYKSVKNGARVIDVSAAFRETGLNDKGQPKLAVARADWKSVYFHPRCWLRKEGRTIHNGSWRSGGGAFTDNPRFTWTGYEKTISLPENTFDNDLLLRRSIRSAVPHVPPDIRPTIHLRNFHILFEVENWETYPVDPFLLRRIYGNLFVVLAEWELTELEAAILTHIQGN